MVTLRVIGNATTNEAHLNERQLSLIRQAKYHQEEACRLERAVILDDINFALRNDWTDAQQAISYYIHSSNYQSMKVEVIYDA